MSDSPSIRDFLEVRDHFGLPGVSLVEKDWHLLRAVRAMAALEDPTFQLVFAGGTCLARAHRLIRRMSEDVDYKLVPVGDAPANRSRRRRQLRALRTRITECLDAAGFPVETMQLRSRNDNHYLCYQLPYEATVEADTFLRPAIQLELTCTRLRLPSVDLPMSSFVAEAFDRPAEVPSLTCVSVTETAAEKLVSLTRRLAMELAGVSRNPDPTLVRHIYDLHVIRERIDPEETGALARQIAQADAEEFKNQYPAYADDIAGETRKALLALRTDADIAEHYARFAAAMVYDTPPSYDEALTTVFELADALVAA